MSVPHSGAGRLRAYIRCIAAVLWLFLARSMARHAAQGLAAEQWFPLAEQIVLVFLLLLGYAGMGFTFDGQLHPVGAQGLPRRPGWPSEAGLGLAVGWALVVICVLPLALVGGIAISFSLQTSAWGWLLADAAFFALAALAEELAFRGYGFQRFAHAAGPLAAALGFAVFFALLQARQPGSNHASFAVSVALSLVLSSAYLRTKALWLSWGLNFGWKAGRALLFGLAVSGNSSHSPVVQGDPMGPSWLTGGGFGLDGSWFAFFVLLAALPVVFRVTRALEFQYNAPVFVPGGIPVDLDAAAMRQHEAAMRPVDAAAPGLVQILPTAAIPPPRPDDSSVNPTGQS